MNSVCLVGRMTKDPDLRRTLQGKAVSSFTLAVDRGYDSQDGQSADFIPVVVWGKQAEAVSQYCHKGSLVGVEGSLRQRSYEKDGKNVYVVEVLANRVQFLTPKKEEQKEADSWSEVKYGIDDKDIQF